MRITGQRRLNHRQIGMGAALAGVLLLVVTVMAWDHICFSTIRLVHATQDWPPQRSYKAGGPRDRIHLSVSIPATVDPLYRRPYDPAYLQRQLASSDLDTRSIARNIWLLGHGGDNAARGSQTTQHGTANHYRCAVPRADWDALP